MAKVTRGWVLAAALMLLGCGGDDTMNAPPEDDDGGSAGPLGTVDVTLPIDFSNVAATWSPCPLFDDPPFTDPPADMAECAQVELPLLYDGEDDRTLTVSVKRLLSATQPAATQLWFMAGGPGVAGTRLYPALMQAFAEAGVAGGIDAYAVDHRGTGGSSLLECPGVQDPEGPAGGAMDLSELAPCADHLLATHGDRLVGYAETFSAIDLMALIEAERQPGQRVFLTGGSAGTILGQRFLQLFPNGADGMILEAINPADRTIVAWADAHDGAMGNLLDINCNEDPACGPRLDDAPFAVWEATMESLAAGSCPGVTDALTLDAIERLVSNTLLDGEDTLWAVPAMIHRLRRCEPADVDVVLAVYEQASLLFTNESPPVLFSQPLLQHISYSETVFNERFATVADIEAYAAEQRDFGKNLALRAAEGVQIWEKVAYADPVYDNGWATTAMPMLMNQGRLDPLTPALWARQVGDNFAAPNQQYVEFPSSSHNFANGSTLVPGFGGMVDCRYALWVAFMEAEGAPIDTGCVANVPAVDFDPAPEVVQALMGVDDAWD